MQIELIASPRITNNSNVWNQTFRLKYHVLNDIIKYIIIEDTCTMHSLYIFQGLLFPRMKNINSYVLS